MQSRISFLCKKFIALKCKSYKFKSVYYASMTGTCDTPANNYLLKVNNRNITKRVTKRSETFSNIFKFKIKDTRSHWRRSGVFVVQPWTYFSHLFGVFVVEFWKGKFCWEMGVLIWLKLPSYSHPLWSCCLHVVYPTSCSNKLTQWTGKHL